MNFRMTLGGSSEEHERRYSEGYNKGYTEAMEEMRRGRRRARSEYMPWDDREPYGGIHWPVEMRRIGFGEPDEPRMHHGKGGMTRSQEQMGRSVMDELDPHMEGLLESAMGVLDEPPSTWKAYTQRSDYLGIAKMEGKELLNALEAHKPVKDIRKELTHTLAALLQLAMQQ